MEFVNIVEKSSKCAVKIINVALVMCVKMIFVKTVVV